MTHERNSIIDDVMPGWNGSESIVAYSIRMRQRKHEQAEARRHLFNLIALPAWLLVGIYTAICIMMIILPDA